MADNAHDLVLSYSVHRKCKTLRFFEPVRQALENGYRVVDVIPFPATTSNDRNASGDVVVTVILTNDRDGLAYRYNPTTVSTDRP
jgi:hypothetical protein